MKLDEIVKAAREANAAAFGNVSEEQASKIVRAAFRQVGNQLESMEEGKLDIGSLGRFTIKKVEREKDGVKVTRRRVNFRRGRSGKGRVGRKASRPDRES